VDEFGIEMTVKCRKAAPLTAYSKQDVYVPPVLAKWLRPHQREGVQFMYECVMGLKGFQGNGCILADDMGLVGRLGPSPPYLLLSVVNSLRLIGITLVYVRVVFT